MMKKISLIIFITVSYSSYSQKGNIRLISEYEDTLKVIAHQIMNASSEEKRRISNDAFISNLTDVLQYEKSFVFPFDSLVTIAKIKSASERSVFSDLTTSAPLLL